MKKTMSTMACAVGISAGLVLAGAAVSPAVAVASLPSTDHIYAITCDLGLDDFTLMSVATDGTATEIGTGDSTMNGKCAAGAAWDPASQIAYFTSYNSGTDNMDVYSTDVSTGTPTFLSTLSTGTGSFGNMISINSAGAAQVVKNGTFYDANLSTGVESEIISSQVNGTNGFYYVIQAFNQFDGKLYAINADNTEDDVQPINNMLYTVDPATGIVFGNSGPHINGLPDVGQLYSMAFDSAGTGWAIADAVGGAKHLWSFDVATATFVDQGPLLNNGAATNMDSALFIAQPVVTPTLPNTGLNSVPLAGLGLVLAITGAASLVLVRRRSA